MSEDFREGWVGILGLVAVMVLSGLFVAPAAWAQDHIISRAVLADPAGVLSIDEVVGRSFDPSVEILSRGYTDTVHWLQIVVRRPEGSGPLELRIRPSFLDEVRLYEPDPANPGTWRTRVTGDRYGYGARDRAAITLGFVVSPVEDETTYYLRLATTSSSLLNVQALEPRAAQFADLRLHVYQAFYLGIMLWLLLWAVHDFATHRQAVAAWFLAYQVCYIAYDLAYIGYLAPLVPEGRPEIADLTTSVLVMAVVCLAALFHRALFALYDPPRWMLHGLAVVALLFPLQLLAMASGATRQALEVNSYLILVVAVFFVAAPLAARREAAPGRRTLRMIYGLMTGSLLVSMLPILGFVRAIEWNLHATLIHGLISGALMFLMLHLRSSRLLQEGQQARLALELTRRQLDLEREQKERQARFMAMLTHELKTPVSVVRMALGLPQPSPQARQHALTALADIDAIIERCRQSDQLDQEQWDVHHDPCRLEQLFDEIRTAGAEPERFAVHAQDLPEIRSDPQLLKVILGNLVDNALKYAGPGTPIHVVIAEETRQGRPGVSFAIENEAGPAGLPDPERVFAKYYRSAGAHGKSGSGQGLYLVRGLSTLLAGEVVYEPRAGQARFTLWIPS